MGLVQSYNTIISREKQQFAPSYNDILNEITSITSCPTTNGFEVSFSQSLKYGLFMTGFLSIKPRNYPVEFISKSMEQKMPGNYSFAFTKDFNGIPFNLILQRNSPLQFQTKIPIDGSSNMSISSTIGLYPSVHTHFERVTSHSNVGASLIANSGFNDGSLRITASLGAKRTMTAGAVVIIPIGMGIPVTSTVFQCQVGSLLYGAILNFGERFTWSITSTRHVSTATSVGMSLQVDSNTKASDAQFGFQRAFLHSKVCSAVNLKGAIASIFQRNINEHITIYISSFYNIPKSQYSFGMAIDLKESQNQNNND